MQTMMPKIRPDQQIGGSMEDSEREGPIGMMGGFVGDIAGGVVDLFTKSQIDNQIADVTKTLFPDLVGRQILGLEKGQLFPSMGTLNFKEQGQRNPAEEEAKAKKQKQEQTRRTNIMLMREAIAIYREGKAKNSMADTLRVVEGMNSQQLAVEGGYQAKYEHADSVYNRVWVALKLIAKRQTKAAPAPVAISNSRNSKMAGMMNANGKGEKYSVTSQAAGMAG